MRKGQVMKQHMALILMQLLSKKRQRKLTVAEFLEQAEVSRTTFYYHFPNGMCGLFRWTLEQEVLALVRQAICAGHWEEGCHEMVQFIMRYPEFCLNLYRFSDEMLRCAFFESFTTTVFKQVLEKYRPHYTDSELKDFEIFYSGALINQIDRWFEGNLKEPGEAVDVRVCFNLRQIERLMK
ncbi:TetR/AcrR family transcriptional regulator [Latilactobacillus sakei]|uniref:TetR/AcrR family transcriptional regulator n=1 Tax=Latilactobacillus sakei TaxID=1599 RepID=UPI002030D502|nr:TetR/AcrR family transcriptional regulator [Latilactobacillus sakei]MCM1598462.1 TetR/AcrR family transcriptional regulator [Latilactobacillus sakei]